MEQLLDRKRHFDNLDATRFIAFIPVFLTHCFFTSDKDISRSSLYYFFEDHVKIGLIGLDYFFVLSSFLITWIILEEYDLSGKFRIMNFWVRRCLRIWPLYFLMVALGFTWFYLSNTIHPGSVEPLPEWYNFIFFTLNFYSVKHGIAFLFFLTIFWSVSIEEQFYLVWALLLRFAKKFFVLFCIALIITSLVFRWLMFDENNSLVFHTFSALGNFAIGALVAYACYYKNGFYQYIRTMTKNMIALVYFLFGLCVIFYSSLFAVRIGVVPERLLFACFYGFIIAEQSFATNSLFKLGGNKKINYLGTISFGLYCYHGVVITLFAKLGELYGWDKSEWHVFILNPSIAFVLTIVMALLSYEWFEKRILKLKYKYY